VYNSESIPRKPSMNGDGKFLPCHIILKCVIDNCAQNSVFKQVIEGSQSAKQTPLILIFASHGIQHISVINDLFESRLRIELSLLLSMHIAFSASAFNKLRLCHLFTT